MKAHARISQLALNAILAANVAYFLWRGSLADTLGAGLAFTAACALLGGLATWRKFGSPVTTSAIGLVLLSAAQWPWSGDGTLYVANAMLTMSLLPAVGSTRLVAFAGVLLGSTPSLTQLVINHPPIPVPALPLLGILLLQTVLLALRTRSIALRDQENGDVEFLIRAMGTSGPIRLNLAVVRADTELGKRLKHVQERMAAALRQTRSAVSDVKTASAELSNDSQELAQRTERSASGLRDTAMTLEQISVIVKTSADAAMEARTTAERASQQADHGAGLFNQVTEKMRAIDTSSREIGEIVGVIEGIAFQTNILALNAAVEAARAGEQGRGFAVVAGEVRSLALRASTNAAQIKALIQRSNETVRSGTTLVEDAGKAMTEIVSSVRNVGQVFATLSADTSEHAGSIESVTGSVMELDTLTRDNVRMADTLGRIANDLMVQGHELEQMLGAFRLGDTDPVAPKGQAAGAAAARPRNAAPATTPTSATPAQADQAIEYF